MTKYVSTSAFCTPRPKSPFHWPAQSMGRSGQVEGHVVGSSERAGLAWRGFE